MTQCATWAIRLAAVAGFMGISTTTFAGGGYIGGGGYLGAGIGCGPQYQVVQKTVMVPQMVPETRMVNVTEYHTEVRQRTVTVHRRVPETKAVTENYTVMVPEKRTRTQTYTSHRPVWEEVQQNYTVPVPYQEKRQGVRQVCQPVQVQETRTVCRDAGHWETVTCQVPCHGGCGPAHCGGCPHTHTVTRQVWCPNPVMEQVPVTVWKTQMVEQPFEYTVTLYRPETRTRTARVCRYVAETQSREVPYVVHVPQQRTRTRQVTSYRVVPEEQVQNYTVCVPTVVQKPVTVMVCQMVPKTVTCHVPVAPGHK